MSKTATSDESIVAEITAGNVEMFAEIMARYEAKLTRYVIYLIHDNGTATDVVQETFIKAYQNLNSFNTKYKFSSWIYRIAHNEAMNAIKKHRFFYSEEVDDLPSKEYEQNISELIDDDLLKINVHDCLRQLEPKYREVIQLVYFENMKYDDVSDVLHIPSSTVGVWLSRAKSKLKLICTQKGVKR
jgi:RNA polymerase sigma-70 factor (ECF subfamily)